MADVGRCSISGIEVTASEGLTAGKMKLVESI